ncbi:MAG: ArsR/SmtB family transcription factor [Candidatus Hydrothermarchaeales archaeon]
MTREQINKTMAIYRALSNESNMKILRELRKRPAYIIELEKNVDLDRSTIKRRLYILANLGLVKTETRETPKGGKAVYYELEDVKLSSLSLYNIIDNCDIREIKEMTRVYQY